MKTDFTLEVAHCELHDIRGTNFLPGSSTQGKGGIEIVWPTMEDYLTSIEIMVVLLETGKPIPAIDVVLAAICLNRKTTLVTKDKHFSYVKSIKEELLLEVVKD